MADPINLAAEEMAPAPAGTSFFAKNAGPIFRSAAAGRRLEDQRLLGEEVSGLSRSRLQRRLQQRQDTLWDRDEQEYQDKQAFKASRGEFLSAVSLLDPSKPSYSQERDELWKSLPPEAADDDAFQSIMRFKDDAFQDLSRQREDEDRETRLMNRFRTQETERAAEEFFRLEGTEEEYNQMLDENGAPDVRALYRAIGRKEAARGDAKLQRALDVAADKPLPRTELENKIDVFIEDKDAFPLHVPRLLADFKDNGPQGAKTLAKLQITEGWKDRYEEAAAKDKAGRDRDEVMAVAMKTPEEEFVNVPGISKAGKEVRRKVWRAARQAMGEEVDTPAATPAPAPAPAPAPSPAPAPAATPAAPAAKKPAPAEAADEDAGLVNSLLKNLPKK